MAAQSVLITTKTGEDHLIHLAREMAIWICRETLCRSLSHSSGPPRSINLRRRLRYRTPETCSKLPKLLDLLITLGGDGTILLASWLLQRIVPPIMPFALGSPGFLTNFHYANHQQGMHEATKRGVSMNPRIRYWTVYRDSSAPPRRRIVRSGKTNEILINILGGNYHMTTVQGDSLTVPTPPGSTAHSSIPKTFCGQSPPSAPARALSSWPTIFPGSMESSVYVPKTSRNTTWTSFDSR
ncbi:hypothetical protein PCASD_12572 [Puccinia coronata f. sp. avenae]|uniref:NAD(+) kinase n=1 Tax=Puccinia coronata f. sp. avenae TaxID=200324 RepID=A0A2N5UM34_9BASI|nr:hypothetical protein PCASD_12572 [Puccinia coronata f. sp. avenae]